MTEKDEEHFLLFTDQKGGTGDLLKDGDKIWKRIDVATVRTNMKEALRSFTKTLPSDDDTPGFKLTEIEVALTIGASGEVGFLGTGVSVNGSATLTIHLSR
jgi:hypothetical protein